MAQTSHSAQDEMIEFFKNRKDIEDATMKKKENDNNIKDEIEKQFREQAEILSEWISDVNVRIKASKKFQELKKNKSVEQFENEYLNHF